MGKRLRRVALPIVGGIIGGPLGASAGLAAGVGPAIGAGIGSLAGGGSPKEALLSGAGSFVGGNLFSGTGGTVGSALNKGLGQSLGQSVGSIIGPSNVGANLGQVLGSAFGSNLASSLVPQKTANPSGQTPSAVFKPKREAEKQSPASFNFPGSLSPLQMTSNIATQGVYGGGAGPEETDYFLNMMNRRLITDEGVLDRDLSEINPIENSFLSQLGLGGMSSSRNLLEAISRYRAT